MRRRLPRCPDHEESWTPSRTNIGLLLSHFLTQSMKSRKRSKIVSWHHQIVIKHWFMMIYDDVWSCMMIFKPCFLMIYDNLWWFMMMCDGLWWLMMIYPLGKDLTWGKRLNSSGKTHGFPRKMIDSVWGFQLSMFVYQRVTIGPREFDHQQSADFQNVT